MTGYQDPMVQDAREDKLPKWAALMIVRLRQQVEAAERKAAMARLATDPHGTDTIIDAYADIPIGLPKGANVRFKLGATDDAREYVDIRVEHGRAHVMGGGMIDVRPRSGNVVIIGSCG